MKAPIYDQGFETIDSTAGQYRRVGMHTGRSTDRPDEIFSLVLAKKAGIQNPELRNIQLYYLVGVSTLGIDDIEVKQIFYYPEFLYVADIGLERLAGLRIQYKVSHPVPDVPSLGDPDFPDFENVDLVSLENRDDTTILYPDIAGSLLVTFKSHIELDEAQERLSNHLSDVRPLVPSLNIFHGYGGYFEEDVFKQEIEDSVADIKGVQMDRVMRDRKWNPVWTVSRIL